MRNRMIPVAALLVIIASVLFMAMPAYAVELPVETPPPVTAEIADEAAEDMQEEGAVIEDTDDAGETDEMDGSYDMEDYMTILQMFNLFGASDAEPSESAIPQDQKQTANLSPFTPDGQATVIDWVYEYSGKEFYTFTTPSENVFYLIIDHTRENNNVYFLNAVTESDLIALAETAGEPISAGESAIPVATQKPPDNIEDTGGSEPLPIEAETPPKDNDGGSNGMIIFIVIAVLALGGAGYYIKIVRPKQQSADSDDDEDEPEDDEDIPFDEDADEADGFDDGDGANSDDGKGDVNDGDYDFTDTVEIDENDDGRADSEDD